MSAEDGSDGSLASREERIGLLFAGLCALDGAFTAPLAKLNTGMADASFVAAAVVLFGALAAAAQLAVRGELGFLLRRDVVRGLVAIGFLGTAVAFLLYFEGSERSTAIETTLCVQIEPAYALLLSWVALGHTPTLARVIATAAILAGIAIAIGLEQAQGSAGVWLLLSTPLAWQLSHLVVLRTLRGVPPHVLAAARYLYGGAFLVAAWIARGGLTRIPDASLWPHLVPTLALQGVVLGWGGTLLWYNAIRRLDLARATSIVVPSIPLLSFGASFVLLGEVASAREWVGLALTAAGVVAYLRSERAA